MWYETLPPGSEITLTRPITPDHIHPVFRGRACPVFGKVYIFQQVKFNRFGHARIIVCGFPGWFGWKLWRPVEYDLDFSPFELTVPKDYLQSNPVSV